MQVDNLQANSFVNLTKKQINCAFSDKSTLSDPSFGMGQAPTQPVKLIENNTPKVKQAYTPKKAKVAETSVRHNHKMNSTSTGVTTYQT